jgi:hypothetical protein
MKTILRNLVSSGMLLALLSSAHALTIVRTNDASMSNTAIISAADAASASAAFDYAAAQIMALYNDPVQINIILAATTDPTVLGKSTTATVGTFTYAQIRSLLINDNNAHPSADGTTSTAALPAADPYSCSTFLVARALAKALGNIPSDATNDGTFTFGTSFSYTYDPLNRAVAGKVDFIGVAFHEITEVMGRYARLNSTGNCNRPYDVFRFTGAGVQSLTFTDANVYFSVNGGSANLKTFNANGNGGDLGDWASGTNDAFNAFSSSGVQNDLTPVDVRVMDVIGYDLGSTPTPTPTGSLQVTISPAGAVSAGAQWQVDGGPYQNSGVTVNNLSVGTHAVAFKPISGWTTPSSQSVTINANQTTQRMGTYTQIITPTPTPGPINCDTQPGIIIHDDNTIENGYGANPATVTEVRFADKFTPVSYPANFSSMCVAFLTIAGTPTTLNFDIIAFDDDGAGGAPGTQLGSMSVSASGIPGGITAPVFQTYNTSSMGVVVTSGSVYIGVRYTPLTTNVFVASDESTAHPIGFAGGYWWNNSANVWATTQAAFPAYRSMFVRAVLGAGTSTPTPTPPGSLVVTNINSQGSGSLASAIATANSNPSPKTISFNLPGGSPWTITVSGPLLVTAPVRIDGTSQPGYNGQANRVYVEGAPGVANIFDVRNHSGTTIKGLGIYYYDNTGVMIDNATGIWIEDCYVGFKQTSGGVFLNRARAPFSTGIGIRGSLNQVHRSTVSGVYNGIVIGEPNGQTTGFISTDNLFEGNNLGADPTGQTTVGYENSSNGISLGAGVKSSWIGSWTLDPSGFNVIAGNGGSGIEISHPTDDHNRIFYNYFGVNRGGTRLITGSTNQQAILINNGAQYNAAWGNIIAGNRGAGIIIESSNNWVLGNTIGLNQAQTQALSGQPYGVILRVDNAHTPGATPQGNAIGGSGAGNMICNQSFNGIEIDYGTSNGVMCNWIGINGSGQPFPNAGWGAYLLNATGNSSYGCFNAWGPNGLGRVGESGGCCNSIQ